MTSLRYEERSQGCTDIVPFLLSSTPQKWAPKVTSGGMDSSLGAGPWSTSAGTPLGEVSVIASRYSVLSGCHLSDIRISSDRKSVV